MSTEQMNSADAAWLHMDGPTNLMVVDSVLWFDEPIDSRRIAEVVRERLVERFPRFRQRVVEPRLGLGLPSWEEDPGFDLDRHIHHLALAPPGDRTALQELVGDLISVPLDHTKPLWDMYVVDGFGTGTALVSRMHHCIADGIALSRVLLSMTDDQPDAGIQPATETEAGYGHRGPGTLAGPLRVGTRLAEGALHEGFALLAHPRSQLRGLASQTVAESRALEKLLLTAPDRETVLRGKPGARRRVTWSERIALDDVRAIAHASATTVNDVLVAAMTGALRRYLADRHSSVDELRAIIPVNLRPLEEPLPRELGNRFGLVYLDLPIGLRSRRQRLEEVHRRMDAIKSSPEGALAYDMLGLIGLTPAQVERRLIDVFSSKGTLVLTNVPGPRQPVYFAGQRVAGAVGWVPAAGGIGVGLSILSYDGAVTVGLRADAGLVSDPQAIIDAFEHELELIAHPRTRRRTTTRRRRDSKRDRRTGT